MNEYILFQQSPKKSSQPMQPMQSQSIETQSIET